MQLAWFGVPHTQLWFKCCCPSRSIKQKLFFNTQLEHHYKSWYCTNVFTFELKWLLKLFLGLKAADYNDLQTLVSPRKMRLWRFYCSIYCFLYFNPQVHDGGQLLWITGSTWFQDRTNMKTVLCQRRWFKVLYPGTAGLSEKDLFPPSIWLKNGVSCTMELSGWWPSGFSLVSGRHVRLPEYRLHQWSWKDQVSHLCRLWEWTTDWLTALTTTSYIVSEHVCGHKNNTDSIKYWYIQKIKMFW